MSFVQFGKDEYTKKIPNSKSSIDKRLDKLNDLNLNLNKAAHLFLSQKINEEKTFHYWRFFVVKNFFKE